MEMQEYQMLAMRTSPDDHDRVLNGCLGLMGEAGEVADVIKKWLFQSGENAPLPKDKLIDEIGDVLWYCAELCTGLYLSLDAIITNKQEMAHYSTSPYGNDSLEKCAFALSSATLFPFQMFMLTETPDSPMCLPRHSKESIICRITSTAEVMLRDYCDSSLKEAMERNIEKLRKRYPDGFDPERSLHRDGQ